ncbi:MAG TPA: carboxynorspermidine decarboxylase [Fibrobacteraceae bacterium]|jgi:carboxynorspermidine decarboxylase|nr:carboxynorspermidine decarboxylase [Fibrobacter sp.]HPW94940.1 carboxynorspermidine decarboxylase [Fibrobacteraceae bacterium]HQB64314.1 carboxynorspermidine decarboxylase [Fibrobacteraceae bacterium]
MIDYSLVPSPCFVLEETRLRRNLEILNYVQKKSGAKIICALKGFSMWSTFPIVGEYLPGATASSLNEALLAKNEMRKEVHVFAPLYEDGEIDQILSLADHISFNSFSQWERFKNKVLKTNVSPGIRVNPESSSVETDLYNPCGRFSRLGVTLKEFKAEALEGIEGFHFHALCEQNVDALETVLQAFEEKFGRWIPQMKWVNFGGGHHITRKDYEVDKLVQLIISFKKRYPGIEVILEPGEAVGWQTGELVATVGDIVYNETDIAILNISVSAHMPDCLEMPYRPMVRGSGIAQEKKFTYKLTGNTCLAGDVIGDYSFDEPLKVGDRLIFEDMIHYTMVKTTFFNGVRHPDIGIWTKENQFHLVRHFTYEQFRDKL